MLAAIAPAGAAGAKAQPVCRGSSGLSSLIENRTPAQLPGSVDPSIAASFGVLRRAGTAGDEPPPLNPLAEEVGDRLAGYYPGEVHQLFQFPDGRRFFLVVGLPRLLPIPPAQCLPSQLRSRRKQLVEDELKRAQEPLYCIVGVATLPVAGPGNGNCSRFAEIYTGASLLLNGGLGSHLVVDLVPDGVAEVNLRYSDGTLISASVLENAYVFTPPPALVKRAEALFNPSKLLRALTRKHLSKRERREYQRRLYKQFEEALIAEVPGQVQWLAGDGYVVRTIRPVSLLHARPLTSLVVGS